MAYDGVHLQEMFDVLREGGGIAALTRTAYSYLQNPVAVCDTSFSLIINLPDGEGTGDLEKRGERIYIKDMAIEDMRAEGVVEKIFHHKGPFYAWKEGHDYQWMYCSIRINRMVVGYVCLRATQRPFAEGDAALCGLFADMLSLEMQKNEFFAQKTGLRFEYFLSDLLAGRFDNAEYVAKRMARLGKTLYANCWVLVLDYDAGRNAQVPINYYVDQMHAIFPAGMSMIYQGQPILLLSRDGGELFSEYQRQKLEDYLEFNQMRCAVSYRFTDILETSRYFAQTAEILKLPVWPETRLRFYGDCAAVHVVAVAAAHLQAESLVHPDIKMLMAHDEQHNTQFFATLLCYLKNDRNALQTAKALHIHKSTFFYRASRMQELFGILLEDCKRMFLYELSMAALELENTLFGPRGALG